MKKNGECIGNRIQVANTFYLRLRGLLFRKNLEEGEGLLLFPCRQIHTFLMRFALDVLFLDKNGKIIMQLAEMTPGRWSPFVKNSYQVLELPAGSIRLKKLKKDDCLEIINLGENV